MPSVGVGVVASSWDQSVSQVWLSGCYPDLASKLKMCTDKVRKTDFAVQPHFLSAVPLLLQI